jgi:hypothetical protein
VRHLRVGLAAGLLLLLIAGATGVLQRRPAKDLTVSGELVRFEVSRRRLTLRTDAGDGTFVVADDATIDEGARKISAAELASAAGHPAKVWYRVQAGERTASRIRISSASGLSQ